MEKFDRPTEAVRKVKEIAQRMAVYGSIFLVYCEYRERYYICRSEEQVSDLINALWMDSGCESNPEDEASEYRIWQYDLAFLKVDYPASYRHARRSAIGGEQRLVRTELEVEPQTIIQFNLR